MARISLNRIFLFFFFFSVKFFATKKISLLWQLGLNDDVAC